MQGDDRRSRAARRKRTERVACSSCNERSVSSPKKVGELIPQLDRLDALKAFRNAGKLARQLTT